MWLDMFNDGPSVEAATELTISRSKLQVGGTRNTPIAKYYAVNNKYIPAVRNLGYTSNRFGRESSFLKDFEIASTIASTDLE